MRQVLKAARGMGIGLTLLLALAITVIFNPSCHLLAFHGILRFNEDEISTTLGKEEPHGRKNYSDILLV